MVYGFIKQSGGHVRLYSEVGHGTTVRLYLPGQEEARAAAKADAPAVSRGAAPGETVLVVEDDPCVRRISVRCLKELGYDVIDANSGPAALLALERRKKVDILFTDVVMAGGMTGFELAHEVRRRRPGQKILFTSGYAEPLAGQEGLFTMDADWLHKPYSINELQTKLRDLLGR
jgi:CheY-like chemotaxis protein